MSFMSSSSVSAAVLRDPLAGEEAAARSTGTRSRSAGSICVPGAVLAGSGLPMPTLNPQQAMLIEFWAD